VPSAFDPRAAFQTLLDQVALGVRAPGTDGHRACSDLFAQRLADLGYEPTLQRWDVSFREEPTRLTNVLLRIPGTDPAAPSTLLGSHYDARWEADHDPDPHKRGLPIPAANDGGSGTAVLMELARRLAEEPPAGDVVLAWFDGEDLGDIDGFEYAVGSRRFVQEPVAGFEADRVIALDMVGGRNMRLNIECNGLQDPVGHALFVDLFQRGRAAGHPAFFDNQVHWIYSDHGPFLDAGRPAICLIDIDYPQWHTHADLPHHCDPDSLGQVGSTLLDLLRVPESPR
jgi:Zn-dependent M28 family amino/carboxypeptidase